MENTEETEIDIEDIGTILKSSRLKSKRSLEEISGELCIRKIYLTALEENDYETLPPVPYGLGYVRTYARYLGLSPERIVKLYKTAAQLEDTEREETEESEPEANRSNKWHIIIGTAALIAFGIIWNYAGRTSPKPVTEESIELPEAVETEENAENVVEVDEKEVTETEHEEEKVEEKAPEEAKEKPVISKDGITLLFNGETWIELKDKNKVYVQGVFHKGDKKDLAYVKNMFLTVGRPRNIEVYVKGVKKDVLAKKRKTNIPLDSLN